jgi:polyisoprenoid-binding protein YceI
MTAERATSVQAPPAGSYRIDPQRSQVSYTGRHMFGLGVVHATFAISSGELQVVDPLIGSSVVVTVAAGSFRSNSAKRDKDVRSASLLDVAAHPDITFCSEALRCEGDTWQVTGIVTAHGNAVPVEVVLDHMTPEAGGVRVHGRADHLDRYAFGVTNGKGMVGRYLDLDLDVFAVPA